MDLSDLTGGKPLSVKRMKRGGPKKDIHMMLEQHVVEKLERLCAGTNASRAAVITELIQQCDELDTGA